MKIGTLVWLDKNDFECGPKLVGTVIAPLDDKEWEDSDTFYVEVACNGNWYLRTAEKIRPLTDEEKVLYMFESGQQCK